MAHPTMESHPGATPRPRVDSPASDRHDDDRRPGLSAASLFMVLIAFWIVTQIEYVIILGLFGLLLGTILEGPVRRIEARYIPRPAAIFMIYAAIIGSLVLLVFLIIPPISDQADTFREEIPGQLANLEQEWRESSNPLLSGTGAALIGRAGDFLDNPAGEGDVSTDAVQNVIPVISGVTTAIIGIVTILVITFYYMMEKAFIRKLVIGQLDPRRQPRIDKIWQDVEGKVGGWMRGQLVLVLIVGTIATVAYYILDIRFWPLLGLWAGITEIIPLVGPWLGGIPAVIVALTQGWEKALFVTLVIVGIQMVENWVLVPRVMKGAVGLSPLTVFVAILAGTQLMGITGAILAIPIAAAIQVILTDYFTGRQGKRDSQAQLGWRWMLSRGSGREDEEPTKSPRGPSDTSQEGRDSAQTVSADVVLRPPSTNLDSAGVARKTGWTPYGETDTAERPRQKSSEDPASRT